MRPNISLGLEWRPGRGMEEIVDALTKTDAKNLARCEKVIRSGLTQFFAVGHALWDIRDLKLYRESHETFEAYCDEKWDFSKSRVYQLISAAEVSAEISTIVDVSPDRESHIRPLMSVPKENRAEVWQIAVDTAAKDDAGKPRMSARHVEATVEAWLAEQQQDTPQDATEDIDDPDVIDVESKPVDPPVTAPECPNCGCVELEEDDQGYYCRACKESLGDKEQPEEAEELSDDDLVFESVEDLIRNQFDGRLVIAAARLETLAEKIRSDA